MSAVPKREEIPDDAALFLLEELNRLCRHWPDVRREHLSAAMMIGYGVAMGWFRESAEADREGRS